MPYPISDASAIIAAGQSLSTPVSNGGGELASIILPSTWTAANVTMQGSVDAVNWFEIYDAFGNEVVITGTVGVMIATDNFAGCIYLKFRSGTSAVPVTQITASTITVIFVKKPLPGFIND